MGGAGWRWIFIAGRLPIRQLPGHDFSQCGHFIVAEMPALKESQRQFTQGGLPFRLRRKISGRNQMCRDHLAERFRNLVDVNAGEAGIRRRKQRIAQPGGEESLNVAAAAAICLCTSAVARV